MKTCSTPLVAATALAAALSIQTIAQGPQRSSAPSGPVPRRANGTPDLSGVWMPPYVPDMTRNGRDQRGYAEPPFAPTDAPQDREALHAKGTRAELPFTAWGLVEWTSYDPADGGAAHRVLVRGEQPESLGGPHQGVDATLGYAVSR